MVAIMGKIGFYFYDWKSVQYLSAHRKVTEMRQLTIQNRHCRH